MKLSVVFASLVLASALRPSFAFAQASDADKSSARELAIEGYAALEKQDYASAAERFTRADALFHAPTVSLGLARARRGLGQLVAAQEAYLRVVHTTVPPDASAAFTQAIEDARRELDALAPRVPSVTIQVKGTDAPKVTLDGAEVPVAALGIPRSVDPGKHTIRGTARGFAAAETTVTVAEGGKERVTLELKPAEGAKADEERPAPAPGPRSDAAGGGTGVAPSARTSSQSTLGYVGLGVGAAGLVVGGIMGGLALAKHSDISQQCPGGSCPSNAGSALRGDVNTLHTLATASDAALGAGGALAVAGLVVVLTAPKANRSSGAIRPVVGLGFFGAEGTFQ